MRDDKVMLSPIIIKLLCLGPRSLPPIQTLSPADSALVAHLFRAGAPAYSSLWVENEQFLRSEARRLNLRQPAHSGAFFFAEEIALREKAQREKVRR